MECKSYPTGTLSEYKFACIFALYEDKWIFCKHKGRTTWEHPGGHINDGETPIEAAKRELYEETGAKNFDIEPLCDYWYSGVLNGVKITGNGRVHFARVHTLGELPHDSEMEKIGLFDSPPDELTYLNFTDEIFPIALAYQNP
jgi:8-oxo-dGTP diphosphatase